MCWCRTPEVLMSIVEAVLGAYAAQTTVRSSVEDAAALMNPEVINRMKTLHQDIRKHFM